MSCCSQCGIPLPYRTVGQETIIGDCLACGLPQPYATMERSTHVADIPAPAAETKHTDEGAPADKKPKRAKSK